VPESLEVEHRIFFGEEYETHNASGKGKRIEGNEDENTVKTRHEDQTASAMKTGPQSDAAIKSTSARTSYVTIFFVLLLVSLTNGIF
jgi:hypothetical protein